MKVRRREVNIFNMSLLDILCGALGAFCFMMLALFPSYIEAQKRKDAGPDAEERARLAEQRADEAEARADEAEQQTKQEKANQTLIAFKMHWNTTDDVDLWISGPNGQWWGPKRDRLPGGSLVSLTPDATDGTKGAESFWVWNSVAPNSVYRVYAEVVPPQTVPAPVYVRIYGSCRFFTAKGDKAMAMPEMAVVRVATAGQRVELGVVEFDEHGSMRKFEFARALPDAPANSSSGS